MPPKKQAFSTDKEFLLIDAVKNRPQLWDVSNPMYRRNDIKETLWQEVANLIGPDVTAEIVRERFINMRTTFMNNEKRIRESKQRCSGKGTDEIYRPKWSLYTSLLFLKKACVQTESSSNLDVENAGNSQALTAIDMNEEINNNLAYSIQKNTYFDSDLQKWVLLSTTDESNYLQTSCEDSSTMDFNQSLLEHTYSTDKIQQSSIEKNRLSVSNSENSRTLNENIKSPYSSMSSEGTSNLTSVIKDKNKLNENLAFIKRGSKKRISNVMGEAVEALKKISNEKMPILQSPPRTPTTADACEHLGLFIAARLREMEPDIRLHCEIEIMKILNTIGT